MIEGTFPMARLLITGGAGYVGSHCAKAAACAGHDCVVLDNLSSGHREFVRWGPLIEGDIRDAELLDRIFREHRFDAVMHFAALAYVGESVIDPGKYYDVNINGTQVLLTSMARSSVSRLVFSSTCAVYGVPERVPITEDAGLAPVNPYGFTKLACERMMHDFGRAHELKSIHLRYFNAAGADPEGEIGEHHDPETHLIPLVLDAALGRRAEVAIFGSDYPTSDGTAIRDYVHVSDLAEAHIAALAQILSGSESMSLNLGTGCGTSVAGIIAAAEHVTGRKIRTEVASRRAGDPPELVAAPDRARTELGWSARRSDIVTALGDAWRWHLKRFG
jgi:UDP-arabinose 4-epimerase